MSSIFISHSSQDNAKARLVKAKLNEAGYRSIFLDFDIRSGIKSGELWEEVLYDQLKRCQALIVLVSKDSVDSDWCFAEIAFARALGKHMFPVRLDKSKLPRGLSDRQRTDLLDALGENELDEDKQAETFTRLLDGLRAAGLDPKDTFDWDEQRSPYPGLASFDMEDAAIYCGREDKIDEGINLLNELRTIKGVLVLGASGSGKSSLVKAGLLPRLKRDAENWIVLSPFRPQLNPMLQFSRAVFSHFKEKGATEDGKTLVKVLGDKGTTAKKQVEEFINAFDQLYFYDDQLSPKLLITIDQLEELLGDEAQARANAFLDFLAALLNHLNAHVRVIVTLRSDFLGQFQTHPILSKLSFKTLLVNPLESEALPRVIEGPARTVGVKFEEDLCQKLVKDTGDGNALPLLAHALQNLWKCYIDELPANMAWLEYKKAFKIKASFYRGLTDSIAQTANDLLEGYTPSSDEANRQVVEAELRRAFLKLVRITDEDSKAVRRLASWEELPETIHPLLQDFIGEEARLLRLSQEVVNEKGQLLKVSDKTGMVEVSHEALFTAWPLLVGWISESREQLIYKQKLETTAATWWAENKSQALQLTDEQLEKAEKLITEYGEDFLNEVGQAFVEASQQANIAKVFFRQSLEIARTIEEKDLQYAASLFSIAWAEAKAGETDEAHDVFKQALFAVRKGWDSTETGKVVFDAILAYTQLDDADSYLGQIPNVANRSRTIESIAQAAGELSDTEAAKVVLLNATTAAEKIDGAFSKSDALSEIAQAAGKLSDTEAAKVVLLKATTAAKEINDAFAQSFALIAIAQAYGELSDAEAAKGILLNAMTATENFLLASNKSDALIAIAQAYGELSDTEAAKGILLNATTVAKEINDASTKSDALNKIAQAAGELSDTEAAKVVLLNATKAAKEIDDAFSQSRAWGTIAQAAGKLSDTEAAKDVLLNAMTAAKDINNAPSQCFALIAIAQAYGELSDAEAAKGVLLNATKAAKEIDDASSQCSAWSAIAQAAGALGDTEAAKDVLLKATKAAKEIDDAFSQSLAWSAIAQAVGKLSDVEAAKVLLLNAMTVAKEINDTFSQRSALRAIVQAVGKLSDAEAAKVLLLNAMTVAKDFRKDSPQRDTLSVIAQAASELSDVEVAKVVLLRATTVAKEINDAYPQGKVLSAIAQAAGALSDAGVAKVVLLNATTVAKDIRKDPPQRDTLSAIAQAAGALGDTEAAKVVLLNATTVANKIYDIYSQRDVLSKIFEVENELGISEKFLDDISEDPTELVDTLDQVLKTVEGNPDWLNARCHRTLLEVTEVIKRLTDAEIVKPLLEKSLELANELNLPEFFRDKVLASVAVTYGYFAQWDYALKILESINDEEKTDALTQILDLWVEHHKATNIAPATAS